MTEASTEVSPEASTEGAAETITGEELEAFPRTVGRLRALPVDDPVRLRAEQVAASFARDGRLRRRKVLGAGKSAADAAVMAATATGALDRREDAPLREARAGSGSGDSTGSGADPGAGAEGDPRPGTAHRTAGVYRKPRSCYVCKASYRQVDIFYHRLCPGCAAGNMARRTLGTDLTGRRVLLTGGRVKIGFQLALMMLRDGAELLLTSRFPHDTVRRFRAEPGSAEWLDRLTVLAVDLRAPRQVLGLCEELRQEGSRSTSWSTTRRRRSADRPGRTRCWPPGNASAGSSAPSRADQEFSGEGSGSSPASSASRSATGRAAPLPPAGARSGVNPGACRAPAGSATRAGTWST